MPAFAQLGDASRPRSPATYGEPANKAEPLDAVLVAGERKAVVRDKPFDGDAGLKALATRGN